MVELYACRLLPRETFTAQQKEILALLSERSRTRFARFRRSEDAQRSALGELLVRSVVSDRLGVAKDQIQFEEGEHGKPSLRSFKDVHFSISHSGEWVVAAFSDNAVGVDIQKIETRSMDVARRFFTDEEYELILAEPEHNRSSFFYELWTLKESYLKALGHGLTGSLRSFTMKRDDKGFHAVSEGDGVPFSFKQYDFDPDYKLAVCAEEWEFVEDVQVLALDRITRVLKEGR